MTHELLGGLALDLDLVVGLPYALFMDAWTLTLVHLAHGLSPAHPGN